MTAQTALTNRDGGGSILTLKGGPPSSIDSAVSSLRDNVYIRTRRSALSPFASRPGIAYELLGLVD